MGRCRCLLLCIAFVVGMSFGGAAQTYTLTVNVSGNGSTDPAAGTHSYAAGDTVTITATPDTGWAFEQWQGDYLGQDPVLSFPINANTEITAVFTDDVYDLTIEVTGSGITVPSAGSYTYPSGRVVSLMAYPDPGYQFDRWEGGISSTDAFVDVTMDATKTVTAVFTALSTYTLTMAVSGNGTTTPAPGDTEYVQGGLAQLTALPDAGYAFDHWEGDLTGTEQFSAELLMDSNKLVTAVFVAEDHTLTVERSGQGTLVPPEGTYGMVDGRVVAFEANPNGAVPGWTFDHWEGGLTGSDNPASLTMDGDKTVTGVFVESHTVIVNTSGSGTTDPSGINTYAGGTELTLTATPSEGWQFDRWEGDLASSDNPATTIVNSALTITAVFVEESTQYSLTTAVSGSGSVDPAGTTTHNAGVEVTLTASADSGWVFHEWQGDLGGSANPTTLVIDGDKNVTAVFVQQTYTLTTSTTGAGDVDPAPGAHTYNAGEEVTLTAIPAGGWAFDSWSGDLSGSENPTTIIMDANKDITAVFSPVPTYTLTTAVSGGGVIAPEAGTHTYAEDTEVPVTATAESGWAFDHWEGALSGDVNPAAVTMDADKTVTAVFVRTAFDLTVAKTGSGTVDPAAGTHTYDVNTEVTLTATAVSGWQFDHWEGALTGTENPATVMMDADKTVTAVFTVITTYDLIVTVSGVGTVAPGAGTHTYEEDTEVTVTATAGEDWQFDHWEGALSGNVNPATVTMDANKAVTAVFVEAPPESHAADQDGDGQIGLSELLRLIQFYNSSGYHCDAGSEDGYNPGAGDQACTPHSSDYNPQDWVIMLTELLRLIQFYNTGGYHPCETGEDGFCPGLPA